jgi:uncharacterized membrane protein YagU involved in acid resistance
VRLILLSALLASIFAGIPDIFAAAALVRRPPHRILQTVASGLLGEASYKGGWQTSALGLVLQVAMSFVIALIYNLVVADVPIIRDRPWAFGALYGIVVYVVMNFVVVPLSRAYPRPRWTPQSVIAMLLVMVVYAEIISLIADAAGVGF